MCQAEMNLSPTEQRIFDLLGDGKVHRKKELLALIDPDGATDGALHAHLYKLRLKMYRINEEVIAVSLGRQGTGYRRMRAIEVQ